MEVLSPQKLANATIRAPQVLRASYLPFIYQHFTAFMALHGLTPCDPSSLSSLKYPYSLFLPLHAWSLSQEQSHPPFAPLLGQIVISIYISSYKDSWAFQTGTPVSSMCDLGTFILSFVVLYFNCPLYSLLECKFLEIFLYLFVLLCIHT